MRTIAHISDLHFGHLDPATLPALRDAIGAAKVDLVVVSGDLTQRARAAQFQEARRYLDTLPRPQIVVPGNHDIPLYNVFARWWRPLAGYRRHISAETEPFFCDGEIAVLGLNTARSLTFKNGRLNEEQVRRSCERMHRQHGMRILVTHHPFDVPGSNSLEAVVGRAEMAMAGFAACNIDIILTGHMHLSGVVHSAERYKGAGSVLFVQAGTATSSRHRGEKNTWNLLKVAGDLVTVTTLGWRPAEGRFGEDKSESFRRHTGGWAQVSPSGRELR
jgi:3',5'-cyclic AMP phosphodiesterase CpdA